MNRRNFLKSVGSVVAGIPAAGLLAKPAMGGVVSKPDVILPAGEAVITQCKPSTPKFWSLTLKSFSTNQTMTVTMPKGLGLNIGDIVSVRPSSDNIIAEGLAGEAYYFEGEIVEIKKVS